MKTITTNSSLTASTSLRSFLPKASAMACAALAVAALASVFSPSEAQAYACGRSAFGAGCIGPRGAVGVNRNGAVAVGRYGNVYSYHRGSTCFWRNNQRICP
jgi:hypothetical protein